MSPPTNHGTDESADQQRKGNGDITLSDEQVHALVENRITFISCTDTGVSIAIMAVEMLGKRQVTR